MATYQGIGITFGIGATTAVNSGIVGKLQTMEHTKTAEMETVKDEDGITVNRTFYDPSEDASFEYVITGATSSAAATACTVPASGTLVTLTAAGNSAAMNNTVWSVEPGAAKRTSNTAAARVTLPLKRYSGITTTVA